MIRYHLLVLHTSKFKGGDPQAVSGIHYHCHFVTIKFLLAAWFVLDI